MGDNSLPVRTSQSSVDVPDMNNHTDHSLPAHGDKRPAFSPEWNSVAPSGYTISEHIVGEPPITEKPFRLLFLGAGASGIDFLHHAITEGALAGLNVEVVCYEKNHDVGGTWLENRYPGCACDVPSVCYQFPWKPKHDWTKYYSGSKEIWEYMAGIVEEEGLRKYIQLRTEVTSAVWDEQTSKWVIKAQQYDDQGAVAREFEEHFDYFANGSGFLNAWKWPDIQGLHDFKGSLYHTAHFDETADLKGKRVAVIGSGSSGVQTVASIYKDVAELYHWIRSPIWVTAGYGQAYAGENGENFEYSEEQKQEFKRDPEGYRSYRKKVESELNIRFKNILRHTAEAEETRKFSLAEMSRRLAYNEELIQHIIPKDFNVGCRRPTPGSGYLEALVAPKTKVYFQDVHCITPNGFKPQSNSPEQTVDVIICATGFDTSFRPRFPVIGLNGASISEMWQNHALSYISTGVPDIPNYFTYFGPYGPLAQGSLLPVATALTMNLIATLKKIRVEHVRRMSPKPSVVADFGEHAMTFHHRTAWTEPCRSWFKQGRVEANPVVWPGSRLHYLEVISTPRFEDFDIEYISGNRWGWLGNGFVLIEFGGDITYYLNEDPSKK
ncbi:hypothetical protein A1O7_01820 [Cladophialophora yegresii CBS 114405]|uniref:Uncharacterized protein n=1 Tax=Cladophialophora yegresii CBS 114405 TaxID=1182544 RepID=W9X4V0_9EURO|nr:uncharacterized protein A1O7_01820 [Cladophialophora yegresii CBS 114405]EXJ65479.1 hypothetical protein A1O7_01820 [Cladophialophora yegresii CBS 114405]